ncbi:MAG: thiol:disulfide interchange protein [Betaproteobacteria bacterium CG2_30_59_46]|nr:MAG: thiol:disulfide interchange protein [Betaproteobacteria bacterium CG2_30_59_46]PIQ13418.1 MAG: thiol:disulfide interchange protein [Hydrogenophilales bacterium CG18_big_fil_WC_8_21_14_2_50_58_12]PIX99512.1 MAG: thiol:disulfide interchange protein [Hydrogenophilales bacterium CG_4_10_14_3_um_filter_58_23]PJB05428.1 MAG: thiol:disulfide interchange protein [Hydrogenophilales bacterium CG_4_9_14_3_um_filter_59_35]
MRYLIAFFLLCSTIVSADEGDLLEAGQAFKFSARALDGQTLEARYQIAEGYYLYKGKLKFQAEPSEVILGTPQLPAGKVKQDEYFGKVETYRHDLVIRLPYTRGGASRITLKAVSQGCADVGVCYPPQTQAVKIDLPGIQAEVEKKPFLLRLLGGGQDEFLPVDQAFKLAVEAIDKDTLLASFTIAENYYLYRDKIKFSLKSGDASIDAVTLPQGEIKADPNFGNTEVYHQSFQAIIKLKREGSGEQAVSLAAVYQGCSVKGICYPPVQKTVALILPAAAAATVEAARQSVAAPVAEMTVPAKFVEAPGSESSRIGALFKGGSFWLIMASFFGFGLLLALTPCVFPMIPILSGIIVGQGHALTKSRAFGLSLAYVLGMALTYAAVGVAAGLSGTLLSSALQNPWVLGGFALIFVALAFSMFGFYELQMPGFIQNRFNDASNRIKGGSLAGVFAMGALSAVIVGPCVAAPLAGALLYIGQTGDVVLGGSALFSLALGMGAPLLLVGVSAGALLPRAGGWMEAVKSFFGILLLGMAIWLISPVISSAIHMLLWAGLLIVSAMYLRAIDPLPHAASGFAKFWKGVGVVALIVGVALLIGVLSGSRDMLQPLSGLRAEGAGAKAAGVASIKFERVKNVAELEKRLKRANGKVVMLDFYADWCVSCKEFERFTFGDAKVQAKLRDVVLLQADVTANSEDDTALLKKFGLFAPPSIIFFDKSGKELSDARVIGYEPPEKFIVTLDAIIR